MAKKPAKKNELVAIDFESDSGAGFEEADQSAYAIPFLIVLQSGSPQCKRSEGAYIKGAEEGMLFNTVTEEVFDGDEGVAVIPCHYHRKFIEWGDREKSGSGGLIAIHDAAEGEELRSTATKNDKGKDVLPSSNILEDTRTHFVLVQHPDTERWMPAVIAMSSTQIKKSRKWMSCMQGIEIKPGVSAPMFSQIYSLTTVPESNDKGSWFGLKIDHSQQITDPAVYQNAKNFREMVRSGSAKPEESYGKNDSPQEEDVDY